MRSTVQDMLNKLEDLCQTEYSRIDMYHKSILKSQELLEKLEAEYIETKSLLAQIDSKS